MQGNSTKALIIIGILTPVIAGIFGLYQGYFTNYGSDMHSTPQIKAAEPKKYSQIVNAPFFVSQMFFPYGYMGDVHGITVDKNYNLKRGGNIIDCTRVTYRPRDVKWMGVHWLYPDGNWGDKPGSMLVNASKIHLLATSLSGIANVQFGMGGINDSSKHYQGTSQIRTNVVALNEQFKPITIEINKGATEYLLSAFFVLGKQSQNTKGFDICLADLKYL